MSRRLRIDWTSEELDKLFFEASNLWQTAAKGKHVLEVVKLAQISLPEHRRRKFLVSVDHIPASLRTRLLEHQIGKWPEKRKLTGPSPEVLRIQELEQERERLEGELKAARAELFSLRNQPKPPTPYEVLKTFLAEVLAQSRGVNMIAAFGAGPAAPAQVQTVQTVPKHNPLPQGESKPRPPKVMVIGLKPDQQRGLEALVGDRLDLRFFHEAIATGTNSNRIREMARGVERVYCLMDSCSHAQVIAAKEVNENVQRVASTNALRGLLESFAARIQNGQH